MYIFIIIKYMNIILLGAPGAGKGTLAQALIDNYSFVQISTGDLIRAIVKTDSPMAGKLKAIMASGGLVDDATIKEIIASKIDEVSQRGKNIIFDGFPRTLDQAQ
jgi:adenylate kinase